ncbi:MAG: alpha/beta hydrolase [Phenylobacterium zucineum]|nr:MAG: alpha/beta hydrolase [Phenylobacterium zucineum]
MPRAHNGRVEVEYQSFGDDRPETILLVNGLGSQMTRWPEAFCEKLVARGYRVIRFDNRDTGLSTWFQSGDRYLLKDMAADAMAVLDAAGVAKAHIAGVSMGGMIVQRIAIDYPQRVLSLTSIMSAPSGNVVATPEAMAVISNPPPDPAADYEAFIAHGMRNARTIGSPAHPWTDADLRERLAAEHARAFNPAGVGRQRHAIGADGDRTEELRGLNVPTVVLHGEDDPLVQPVGGRETAAAIPGAELRMIAGMGHDLPPGLYDTFVDAIVAAATRAKANA